MKLWISLDWLRLALALFACVALDAAAKSTPQSLETTVVWDVSLDASGHVTSLSTDDTKLAMVHTRLEQAIRQWQFKPGLINGKSAETKTHLSVVLRLDPDADGNYTVKFVDAQTGANTQTIRPPVYPRTSLNSRSWGLVVVRAHFDQDGNVINAMVEGKAPTVDAALAGAALRSAKKWTFAPEVVGGRGVAGDVLVPICFSINTKRGTGCPAITLPNGAGKMTAEQIYTLGPSATLVTDVAGKTL